MFVVRSLMKQSKGLPSALPSPPEQSSALARQVCHQREPRQHEGRTSASLDGLFFRGLCQLAPVTRQGRDGAARLNPLLQPSSRKADPHPPGTKPSSLPKRARVAQQHSCSRQRIPAVPNSERRRQIELFLLTPSYRSPRPPLSPHIHVVKLNAS